MRDPFNGARVALVEHRGEPGRFGVAMKGGRYVVKLPEGYDGTTRVFWSMGWIGVFHDNKPPLLADTTTGETSPMTDQAAAAFLHDYTPPSLH